MASSSAASLLAALASLYRAVSVPPSLFAAFASLRGAVSVPPFLTFTALRGSVTPASRRLAALLLAAFTALRGAMPVPAAASLLAALTAFRGAVPAPSTRCAHRLVLLFLLRNLLCRRQTAALRAAHSTARGACSSAPWYEHL